MSEKKDNCNCFQNKINESCVCNKIIDLNNTKEYLAYARIKKFINDIKKEYQMKNDNEYYKNGYNACAEDCINLINKILKEKSFSAYDSIAETLILLKENILKNSFGNK